MKTHLVKAISLTPKTHLDLSENKGNKVPKRCRFGSLVSILVHWLVFTITTTKFREHDLEFA